MPLPSGMVVMVVITSTHGPTSNRVMAQGKVMETAHSAIMARSRNCRKMLVTLSSGAPTITTEWPLLRLPFQPFRALVGARAPLTPKNLRRESLLLSKRFLRTLCSMTIPKLKSKLLKLRPLMLRVTSKCLTTWPAITCNWSLITPPKLLVTWCKLLPTLLLLLRMLQSLSTLTSLHRRSQVSMQLLLPTAPRLTATWTALLQTIWKLHKTPLEFLSSLTLLVPWKAHLASLNSLLFNNSRKPPVKPFKACFS